MYFDYNFVSIAGTPYNPSATYYPQIASHAGHDGNAEGGNFAWLDGHVDWSPMVAGQSWRAVEMAGNAGFYTSRWSPPAGVMYWVGP